MAYSIEKIRPLERSNRLAAGLEDWRRRFAGRILSFPEEAAMAYGELMGRAPRAGCTRTPQDGMIAAIATVREATVATRNVEDFRDLGVEIVNPWNS